MAPEFPSPEIASKVARSVLTKNLRVKPGENVMIEAWPHTLPWAVALGQETRRLKALPIIHYEDEDAYWQTIDSGGAKLLGATPEHEWGALAKTDVYIHMWGPGDRVRLNAVPAKVAGELFRWNGDWYATAQKNGIRGARLELGRPFPALAKAYGVDEREWMEEVVAATTADPAELEKRAAPVVRALATGRRIHLTHSNGTDLTLGLAKRAPRPFTGRPVLNDPKRRFDMLTTLPSGSVRVALDETVAEGTLVGNRTNYYDDGCAEEPTFEFSNGKLTHHSFASGGERFDGPFKAAGKGRDQPGMFSIGLNPGLHNTPQLEDVEKGAVMVSVGGNANLGGKNKAQFFGWAVVADAKIEIDGKELKL